MLGLGGIVFLLVLAGTQLFYLLINIGKREAVNELFYLLICWGLFFNELIFYYFSSPPAFYLPYNSYTVILITLFAATTVIRYKQFFKRYRALKIRLALTFLLILLLSAVEPFTPLPVGLVSLINLAYMFYIIFLFTYGFFNFYLDQRQEIDKGQRILLTAFLSLFIILTLKMVIIYTELSMKGESYLVEYSGTGFLGALTFLIYLLYSVLSFARLYIAESAKSRALESFRENRSAQSQILNIIQELILKSEELNPTHENILNIASILTNADGGIFYLFDKKRGNFKTARIQGYFVPTFNVNDKLLEDGRKMNQKLTGTLIPENNRLFSHIIKSEKTVLINKDVNDPSRKVLSYLNEYRFRIGSLLAGRIDINAELYGVLILQRLYSNFDQTDLINVEGLTKFSGVIINNISARKMAKEKSRLENEMALAKKIQTTILPRTFSLPGYSIAAFMEPATEVGGDYYDILEAPDGKYWLNIGDVTGHGVTAGLIMLMLQTSAYSLIRSVNGLSPSELAIHTNYILYNNIKNRLLLDQFVTFFFVNFDREGNFEFAGAHEPIIVYRKESDEIEVIKPGRGIWIGLLENIEESIENSRFKIDSGDIVLLYTDGVIELMDDHSIQYDMDRLKSFLAAHADLEPEQISKALIAELNDYMYEQNDDITYLILKKE